MYRHIPESDERNGRSKLHSIDDCGLPAHNILDEIGQPSDRFHYLRLYHAMTLIEHSHEPSLDVWGYDQQRF